MIQKILIALKVRMKEHLYAIITNENNKTTINPIATDTVKMKLVIIEYQQH